MPKVTVTTTRWKAKRGAGALRVVSMEGAYGGKDGDFPTIVLQFEGRTGHRLAAPIERTSLDRQGLLQARASLNQRLDEDWAIAAKTSVEAEDEPALRRAIGRAGMRLVGIDAYEFLASWFPVGVWRKVLRAGDGLETVRIVEVANRDGAFLTFVATKRAGYPQALEVIERNSTSDPGRERHEALRRSGYQTLEDGASPCPDEQALRARLGPSLLGAMSRRDYARIVRGGDNVGCKPTETWGDGYDHGGTGPSLPPTPKTRPAPAPPPSRAEVGGAAATRPRLVPISAPAASPTIDGADHAAYADDPSYGAF